MSSLKKSSSSRGRSSSTRYLSSRLRLCLFYTTYELLFVSITFAVDIFIWGLSQWPTQLAFYFNYVDFWNPVPAASVPKIVKWFPLLLIRPLKMSALFCMRFAVVSFSVLFILLDDSDKWQHSAASCWIKGKNNMIKPRDHHQNEHIHTT